MAKKSVAARTTITVPADLKRRMEKVRDVNWSAVAAAAFETQLAEVAKKKKGIDMESVRERLQKSKEESESALYTEAYNAGQEWAAKIGSYPEVARLLQLNEQGDNDLSLEENLRFEGEWVSPFAKPSDWLADTIADSVYMRDPDVARPEHWKFFWEQVFGDDCEETVDNPDALRGFVDGAIDLAKETSLF